MPLVLPWNDSVGSSQIHSSFDLNGSTNPKIPSSVLHRGPHFATAMTCDSDAAPLLHATTTQAQFSSSPRWSASSVDIRQSHRHLNTAIPSQQQATISLRSEQEGKWLNSSELSSKFKPVTIGNKQLPVNETTMMLQSFKSPQAMPINRYMPSLNQSEQQHSLIAPLSSLSLKVNLAKNNMTYRCMPRFYSQASQTIATRLSFDIFLTSF